MDSFLRMYQLNNHNESVPIVGIQKGSVCIDRQFVFDHKDGRAFTIKAKDGLKSSFNSFYDFTLRMIQENLTSQLKPDDKFEFVIDDMMVKAVEKST